MSKCNEGTYLEMILFCDGEVDIISTTVRFDVRGNNASVVGGCTLLEWGIDALYADSGVGTRFRG